VNFRRRIALVSAAAVAVAVVLASLLTYLLTSHQLRGQVDSQLNSRADSLRFVAHSPARHSRNTLLNLIKSQDSDQAPAQGAAPAQGVTTLDNLPPRPGQVRGYQQLVGAHGHVLFRSTRVPANWRRAKAGAISETPA
jgi:hypothetical protein